MSPVSTSKNPSFEVQSLHAGVILADEVNPPYRKNLHMFKHSVSLHETLKEQNLWVLGGKRTRRREIIRGGAFTSAPSPRLWCNLAHVRARRALWWGSGWRCKAGNNVACQTSLKTLIYYFYGHILKYTFPAILLHLSNPQAQKHAKNS